MTRRAPCAHMVQCAAWPGNRAGSGLWDDRRRGYGAHLHPDRTHGSLYRHLSHRAHQQPGGPGEPMAAAYRSGMLSVRSMLSSLPVKRSYDPGSEQWQAGLDLHLMRRLCRTMPDWVYRVPVSRAQLGAGSSRIRGSHRQHAHPFPGRSQDMRR